MSSKEVQAEDKLIKQRKSRTSPKPELVGQVKSPLADLQHKIGNRAVQRLLAQRSGDGSFELDDNTASQINGARGGGQALDSSVQAQMGAATGHDFSDVKVHTDAASHDLNEQIGAKAFTTGKDIFFRSGTYDPNSTGGQELLAHELTHVVQQGSGQVGGADRMTVNAPGDAYEQEADSVAKTITGASPQASVQREVSPEEEEPLAGGEGVQRQEEEKKDEEEQT